MEDIPQPSSEPYSVGDTVQIYVGSDDIDARCHGIVCEIVEVLEDDLSTETGRGLDGYSYLLRDINSDEKLQVSFRHHDLVPVQDSQ